jgi:hypothetical protein
MPPSFPTKPVALQRTAEQAYALAQQAMAKAITADTKATTAINAAMECVAKPELQDAATFVLHGGLGDASYNLPAGAPTVQDVAAVLRQLLLALGSDGLGLVKTNSQSDG